MIEDTTQALRLRPYWPAYVKSMTKHFAWWPVKIRVGSADPHQSSRVRYQWIWLNNYYIVHMKDPYRDNKLQLLMKLSFEAAVNYRNQWPAVAGDPNPHGFFRTPRDITEEIQRQLLERIKQIMIEMDVKDIKKKAAMYVPGTED